MSELRVTRLNANGPETTGLAKLDLSPDDFQSGLPEQYWHIYYQDEQAGLTVGVWTTTSMQEAFGPYPGDEFMCLLEGNVAMVDAQGNETPVKQAESFCVRNGIPVSWKQEGFLRKFFITYNRPDKVVPKIDTIEGGIHILKKDQLKPKLSKLETAFPFEIEGDLPLQKDASVFINDTENMYVGMWETEPFESLMKPFPCSEFVQLLEGEIEITEQSGSIHSFKPGDVFFIPQGTVCSWKVTVPVRKFYCMFSGN